MLGYGSGPQTGLYGLLSEFVPAVLVDDLLPASCWLVQLLERGGAGRGLSPASVGGHRRSRRLAPVGGPSTPVASGDLPGVGFCPCSRPGPPRPLLLPVATGGGLLPPRAPAVSCLHNVNIPNPAAIGVRIPYAAASESVCGRGFEAARISRLT